MRKINDGLTAKTRYLKKLKRIGIEFNMDIDEDIYNYLQTKTSKQAYIKELIRNDMQKKGTE